MTEQSKEWTMDDIQTEHPDAPPTVLPSKFQHSMWARYVRWDMEPSDEGDWFGQCPLHETEPGQTSAIFNFDRGIMRCEGATPCHEGKRAMSLNNVFARMHQ